MTDLYPDVPRTRRPGPGTNLAVSIPGMRPGSPLWNLLVAVAYLTFAPILVPLAAARLTDWVDWP